jgi:hypothetical protein
VQYHLENKIVVHLKWGYNLVNKREQVEDGIYLKKDILRTFEHRRIKCTTDNLLNKSLLHNVG